MRRTVVLAAASVLALCAAAPVAAQEALAVGGEVSGKLEAGDPTLEDGAPYDDYTVRLAAGQRLEAVLRAADFDAFLELYDRPGGEVIDSDDDGLGEGTDSRLRFAAPADGDYVLRVRPLSGEAGGDYRLSLAERAPAPEAPAPTPIAVGDALKGALAAGDPEADDGSRYDAYAFTARQGERLSISLQSDAFDPMVVVGRGGAGSFEELARNDDAPGGGLNSYLTFTAPSEGDYLIRVTPVADRDGDYTLSLQTAPAPAAGQAIAVGDTAAGELTAEDAVSDAGSPADAYRFEGTAGQRVLVEMSSGDFDTFLELFAERAGGRESLATDDDGGAEGTDSRLSATLPEAGPYVIEARAFGSGEGDYVLTLTEPEPEPEPTPLDFGQTLQGEITDEDPAQDEGASFDAYRFHGEAGRRVQAIMRSGDFDTLLQVGPAGDDFDAAATDDDGLGEGTDSRLNYLIPETGDYVLRAGALTSEGRGLYSVEMIDRGPQPEPGSLLVGETVRGTLSEADSLTEDGAYFDAYRIHVKAGDKLRITLASNDFDAFVETGRLDGDTFASLEGDDDSLSDTHARLDWEASEDGDYVIRARSYAAGQLGAYALTLERKP
jgi:hypothetical protein